jgi:uncharacterized protein YecT (DUF1311 family)
MNRWLRLGIAAAVASASFNAYGACARNERGVYEDIECAVEALDAAKKELEAIVNLLASQLDRESLESFKTAQEAWVTYRAAEARFVYSREGNGSSGRLAVANSSEQATRARIQELRQWLSQQ